MRCALITEPHGDSDRETDEVALFLNGAEFELVYRAVHELATNNKKLKSLTKLRKAMEIVPCTDSALTQRVRNRLV